MHSPNKQLDYKQSRKTGGSASVRINYSPIKLTVKFKKQKSWLKQQLN